MHANLSAKILTLLKTSNDYYSAKEIAELINEKATDVSKKLNYNEKSGLVEKTDDSPKKWCITESGIAYLNKLQSITQPTKPQPTKHEQLANDLNALQQKLKQKTIQDLTLKQSVLNKLAEIMDDSISEVLHNINKDLEQIGV